MNSLSDANKLTKLRNNLVDKLIDAGYIRSPIVEEAFRAVPRHLFVPGVDLEKVYSDNSIPTKHIDGKLVSSSSQPAMMAIMLEQLGLQPGHRVLEIGAGTGYNAGLIQHLVGDSGLVVTVDIDEDIVEGAREHLRSAGLGKVRAVCGDGGLGCADYMPYDRIILTAGAWDIVPAWLDQLKPCGRLLLPLEIKDGIQKSVAFERQDGYLESVSVRDCGFMILRGSFAKLRESMSHFSLGPEPGLNISVNDGVKVNSDEIYDMLSGLYQDLSSGVHTSPGEVIFGGLNLWLNLHESGLCSLSAEGQSVDRGIVPYFLAIQSIQKVCGTIGLLGDEGLCVFVRPPEKNLSAEQPEGSETLELFVRSYGSGDRLAGRLVEQVRAWDAAGRPSSNGLRIRAYTKDTDYIPSSGEYVIDKQWTKIVLDWDNH
ncbi:MAG: methyltransferase, FxLD system [Chloroflexi bacterium RBG_13_46_14]|nr:MAG: methyltransferase, FxLD system [Chloroflexi bacterium RBG_13_46_14]